MCAKRIDLREVKRLTQAKLELASIQKEVDQLFQAQLEPSPSQKAQARIAKKVETGMADERAQAQFLLQHARPGGYPKFREALDVTPEGEINVSRAMQELAQQQPKLKRALGIARKEIGRELNLSESYQQALLPQPERRALERQQAGLKIEKKVFRGVASDEAQAEYLQQHQAPEDKLLFRQALEFDRNEMVVVTPNLQRRMDKDPGLQEAVARAQNEHQKELIAGSEAQLAVSQRAQEQDQGPTLFDEGVQFVEDKWKQLGDYITGIQEKPAESNETDRIIAELQAKAEPPPVASKEHITKSIETVQKKSNDLAIAGASAPVIQSQKKADYRAMAVEQMTERNIPLSDKLISELAALLEAEEMGEQE